MENKITFWRECLRKALQRNDLKYAMYCDEQINKLKNLEIKDYVLYDKANNSLVKFKSGDIVLYGDKNEAIEDCYGNEEVLQFQNLPMDKQEEIINQLN